MGAGRSGARSRAVLALAVALVLLVAACGGDDSADQGELETEGQAEQAEELEQPDEEQLRKELVELRERTEVGEDVDAGGADADGGGGGASTPTGLSYCDPNTAVNAVTSCPFAFNVVDQLLATGNLTFDAYSPTTGQTYTMVCEDFGDAVDCRGGDNAQVVYIP